MGLARFGRAVVVAACGFIALAAATAPTADLKDATRLLQEGKQVQALERLESHLAQHPRDAQARFLKGIALTEQGKTTEAIDVFTGLTQDYPELGEPYNNLAVLYASLGQYDKARSALEIAVQAHPGYATAHENLGDVYARLASREYEKAMQIDKGNAAAQSKLALMRELFERHKPAKAAASKP